MFQFLKCVIEVCLWRGSSFMWQHTVSCKVRGKNRPSLFVKNISLFLIGSNIIKKLAFTNNYFRSQGQRLIGSHLMWTETRNTAARVILSAFYSLWLLVWAEVSSTISCLMPVCSSVICLCGVSVNAQAIEPLLLPKGKCKDVNGPKI